MSEALERAREVMAAKRAAGEAIERLDPIEKARRNPNSLRLAITAKCWECMGGGDEAGTRKMIGQCSATTCPLHYQRPYQQHAEDDT